MRRGHQGIGGWRNENPRHFRPRNGGNPHFRPPRTFNLSHSTRFPHPGPRPYRTNFNHRHDSEDRADHDRNRYRSDPTQYPFSRPKDNVHHTERPILPFVQQQQCPGMNINSYDVRSQGSDRYHINSMGDIDHRQTPHKSNFKVHPVPPWSIDNKFQDIDDRAYNRTYKHDSLDHHKIQSEYIGHRPPSSDHYGGNPTSTIENSNTFSRSVDDTVDIVRKRLLNKGDGQENLDNRSTNDNTAERTNSTEPTSSQHEQPTKKKVPRQRQNTKINCDKIKNKIFHQLFKMDKEKIHKLLDNPNSSTKFEFAINSLLTESQNSFNQHLRSVAEKSLCTSSREFIQDDNNTIYEDTFMKQMQCILDPQDTILLEDIKPVVMAELSKVLQLDDFDYRMDERQNNIPSSNLSNETDYIDQYPQEANSITNQNTIYNSTNPNSFEYNYNDLRNSYNNFEASNNDQLEQFQETKPLFERRPRRKSCTFAETDNIIERRHIRKSVDSRLTDYFPKKEKFIPNEPSEPAFDANIQLPDDEDTFAELDKQYHVAVDHDFIENDELCTSNQNSNPNQQSEICIKQEKENLKELPSTELNLPNYRNIPIANNNIKKEIVSDQIITHDLEDCYNQNTPKTQEINVQPPSYENTQNMAISKTSVSQNSRKRSIEQQPSHRKEKRKKNDEKEPLHKTTDKKSDLSQNSKKNQQSKTSNIVSKKQGEIAVTEERRKTTSDKGYSDKYVKRKETPKISSNVNRNRLSSTSSSHSISPKNNEQPTTPHTPSKSDAKSTLKTIDMFMEQPKKINIHQSFRNTAQQMSVTPKKIAEIKPKPISALNQKTVKKHDMSTQVAKRLLTKETQTLDSKSSTSRFCQTERKKYVSKGIQTDVPDKPSGSETTDAFERMKEIDLEIQVLVQEKFKLYNSLESKEKSIPMQNLGMTVLNIDSFDENNDCENNDLEDDIVHNFTSIPEEELEQIAFESVEENQVQVVDNNSRMRRQRSSNSRTLSESPQTSTKQNKKAKTPNISLIEQIITDDRPLEDIISLVDLEVTPVKSKQRIRQRPKKKAVSKKKSSTDAVNIEIKDCSVVLIREDLDKCLASMKAEQDNNEIIVIEDNKNEYIERVPSRAYVKPLEPVIEETIVNDLQFDMLDVSEDIVIDDNYEEEKCVDEKEVEQVDVPISEEIILDNSQSSMEDVTTLAETQDGECKLYDYSADENLQRDSQVVSGNADAILAIECVEQNFLAAGLDGNVYYFTGDGQLITTLRGSNLAVTCLTIVKEKYGTTVYTGSLDSRIRYFDLETGLEKGPECNVLSPIQTMDRAWDTVFVGTRTGFVLQFECKNNMLIPVSTVKFSDQSILALRAMKEGPRKVLLVAARSENVTIRDAQTGLLLRTLLGPKMTVYTLLYEDGKVFCGTSSPQIHVFDYASGGHVGAHEGGKGAVCLLASGGLVFSGCYDGCVYVYRDGEPRPLARLRGPGLMLLSLAVLGSKMIAGFKDRSLYIWKIPLSILQEMIL